MATPTTPGIGAMALKNFQKAAITPPRAPGMLPLRSGTLNAMASPRGLNLATMGHASLGLPAKAPALTAYHAAIGNYLRGPRA